VLEVYRPERVKLLDLLGGLDPDGWGHPTECPAYPVKGIATHVLGDDLSLLSRQRDGAVQGLLLLADELAGADFRTLLDTFNDRWVAAARFLSPVLLIELLRLSGEWTAAYYEGVDPEAPGEAVGLFGATRMPVPRSGRRLPASTWSAGSTIPRSGGRWGSHRSRIASSWCPVSRSAPPSPGWSRASRRAQAVPGISVRSCSDPRSRLPTS